MIDFLSFVSGAIESRVAVYDDESFRPVFESASPMRVSVRADKTITRFQVEDGGERSDHVVDNAVEIVVEFLLTQDTRNAYQALRDAFEGNRILTVQTKVRSFPSMLIEALPHEETPALGTAVLVPILFVEWRPVQPEFSDDVAQPKQKSTVSRGQQQTSQADAPTEARAKESILYGIFN